MSSQSESRRVQDPDYGFYNGDDDRRRYQRRQLTERRELIRFDLNHIKRRSGQERRVMPSTTQNARKQH
jgi:hypothetical protein